MIIKSAQCVEKKQHQGIDSTTTREKSLENRNEKKQSSYLRVLE